jgi:DNA-binding NarL/FixJ family response regulator
LTERERQVLRLLADGLTNREIAEELHVSLRTVASHIEHILTRLDLRSRTAAVAYAIRNGIA